MSSNWPAECFIMHVKSKNKKGQVEMITHMLIIILLSTPTLVLVCPEWITCTGRNC